MNPTARMSVLLSLAIGTTVTLASHHWLLAWIGLEINTMAIIPFMTQIPHPRAIEAATKYFLTQASASALVLFSSTLNAWKTGQWEITLLLDPFSITLSLALMLKLGLAPLHFWMPEVIQGIPLSTGLILSTWQKIAPLSLLLQIHHLLNNYVLILIGIASILVGGWGGINQTQLRKIMAFSSIGHLGWMIIILKFNPALTLFNFILYILMTAATFLALINISATKMINISSAWSKAPALITITMLLLLSLAGLPPLSGFAPKLFIIFELVKQNTILVATLIMAASLLALFFYIRLTYVMILTTPPNTSNSSMNWRTSHASLFTSIFSSMALFMFPASSTLVSIL
uniref:NADH-ubiquinone oxidoreductase chain 2 n=1 Tax=Phrynoderma hexadactylum TaxID=2927596 RepID=E1NZ29_PHRHX|nr:NADH dehydrogenase subunit 2 [Phrynoderma hexadactylum]BAJ21256.1 NADH dehydrogenase subunit 2 [Phrynoderma hexadactylum]